MDLLRLPVASIANMNEEELKNLVQRLNSFGACVIAPSMCAEDTKSVYSNLSRLFGDRTPHEKMNDEGIMVIDASKPTSVNIAATEQPHMAHTDESFLDEPSRFMTLQCRVAARGGGGASFLVSCADLLSVLTPEEVDVLKQPGMVAIGRRLPGETEAKLSTKPLLWEEHGRLHVRWRSRDSYIVSVAPQAASAFEKMDSIGQDRSYHTVLPLQPTELLIVDNRALAHGRYAFDPLAERVMWRCNFLGNGELGEQLQPGVAAAAVVDERG